MPLSSLSEGQEVGVPDSTVKPIRRRALKLLRDKIVLRCHLPQRTSGTKIRLPKNLAQNRWNWMGRGTKTLFGFIEGESSIRVNAFQDHVRICAKIATLEKMSLGTIPGRRDKRHSFYVKTVILSHFVPIFRSFWDKSGNWNLIFLLNYQRTTHLTPPDFDYPNAQSFKYIPMDIINPGVA